MIRIYLFIIILNLNLSTLSQSYSEDVWTKYYVPVENKIVGIWPHNSRYSDLNRMKEFRHIWGFNHVLLHTVQQMDGYRLLRDAGFDSTKIFRKIKLDSYIVDVESVPAMNTYYIDEPADEGDNLSLWKSAVDWIKNKYSTSQIVLSGYKRNDFLKDYVNSIGDNVMFSSYKHWWELLGLWVSWPEEPDQRPDWVDMKNIFGSKFNFSWIGAHKDVNEYDNLLGKAKNLGLQGVFLFQLQPHDAEVGDDNLEQFSEAAVRHNFMTKYYQQLRVYYVDGNIIQRKIIGPSYLSEIPDTYDHSSFAFEDYIVTNNRIEDYFAPTEIIAGSPFIFKIPEGKNASFSSSNKIILRPGFHAEKGSEFSASIGND